MKSVSVKKDVVMEHVKKNRDLHMQEYAEAVAGYIAKAKLLLQQRIVELDANKLVDLNFDGVMPPTHHRDEYDRVIAMLEVSVDDVIDLSNSEFGQYMMDQWHWTDHFKSSTLMYNSGRR